MKRLSAADLQELTNANIISADQAAQIQVYYEDNAKASSFSQLPVLFGVLGSLLVSLGVVLFIAHNWDELNTTIKTIFAFLPLLIGQSLCAYALLKQKENALWQETAAIVLFFAVPASISLLSQIYNINGSMSGFLMAWLILTFPVLYILRTVTVSYLLISLATWYACEVGYGYRAEDIPWLYLVFLFLLFFHYRRYYLAAQGANAFWLYNWCLVLSLTIALYAFKGNDYHGEKLIQGGYLAFFVFLYSLGSSSLFASAKSFANPFLSISIPAIIMMLLYHSYDFAWTDFYYTSKTNSPVFYSPFTYLYLLFLAGSVYFLIKEITTSGNFPDPVRFSIYIFLIALLVNNVSLTAALLIINFWILLIGLWYVRKGNHENHFGLLNFGLLIIAALAVSRFFDDDIPFIWRGTFFLLAGVGFFAANMQLMKKRKRLL